MKNYGKGKRILPIKEKSKINKIYKAKHSKMDAYKGEKYTPAEKELILTQKDPRTGEHVTDAQIAERIGRTYDGVTSLRRYLKKNGSKKMPSAETFAFVRRLI